MFGFGKRFKNYVDVINTDEIYNQCVEISKKYGLRPPLVTQKEQRLDYYALKN